MLHSIDEDVVDALGLVIALVLLPGLLLEPLLLVEGVVAEQKRE